jgi:flagellin-like hook-associated protein FlgL
MPAIYPVAVGRVSDQLLQKRLLSQFAYDSTQLLRLQDQLSTGYRITMPSQDAPAAGRAITLQRILEQKSQARDNLVSTQSFVTATDSSLEGASELLANVRGLAISAIDSTLSDEQRNVIASEVRHVMEQLVHVGNRQFRGRYLFAGSTTDQLPFELEGPYVVYRGNEARLESFVDVGYLSPSSVTGDEVFGGFSPEVRGWVDLNPVLSAQTRLADLRGGQGISEGSLRISDGNHSTTIDLSTAETLGDVVNQLQANPPEGRQLLVRITATGLSIDMDDAGGGSLSIHEVAGGTTASELGILNETGAGVAPLLGGDLQPRLTPTTRLQDILGVRAESYLPSGGAHNDIHIEAAENGAAWNGTQIRFITNVAAGDQALVNYDDVANVLEIDISPGITRAQTVVDAINATDQFNARLDDTLDAENDGSGTIDPTTSGTLTGGSGRNFDRQSGIQILNKDQTFTLDFADAETIEDVLNVLNGSQADVLATINATGTGIDVRSRVSGADFAIGENGGTTAADLGVRSFTRNTSLDELNYGRGVDQADGAELRIHRRDGTTLEIDLTGAQTIGDVLDRINNHPDNPPDGVLARLAAWGNGIELVESHAAGSETLRVERGSGFAAWDLGLVPQGQNEVEAVETPPGGAVDVLAGSDVNRLEAASVFNSLIRLEQALTEFDLPQIERSAALLDDDYERLNYARADLGTRGQTLDSILLQLDNEEVELRKALSEEIDADLVEVVSQLASRQANLEATLRLVGQMMQLSVLSFL